jgi:protein-S-isoprenylcysteine O-methyltransferase Ste14
MSTEKTQRWTSAAIAALALSLVCAGVWEVRSPDSKTARIIGFVAFGVLCILLRALPRKFVVPKPEKY